MVVRRLFHTVVVIGAAAGTGCGGQSERSGAEPQDEPLPPVVIAGDGGVIERPDAFWPTECASYSQFRCDSYSPLEGCVCDTGAPVGPGDCGGAQRLYCEAWVCPPGVTCDYHNNVECRCVTGAPLSPEECPGGAGQFECAHYTPDLERCSCNENRPGSPEDCPTTDAFLCESYSPVMACLCDGSIVDEATCVASDKYCSYTCFSETPRFGCRCECVTPIK